MRLLIAGDFCPVGRVAGLFGKVDYPSVLSGVAGVIGDADYSIVNLECPVAGTEPVPKVGPSLQCGEEALKALKYAGFSCVTLANNHINDFGPEGVVGTISMLDEYSIDHVGAGKDITEASRVFFKTIGEETVAIVNCCEREFSIAGPDSPGACPLDPVLRFQDIRKAREEADHLVVILHGGYERCPFPSPRMVNYCRFFIDAGADAVICHHQHCASGYEIYSGKPIFYGLGNFCFDSDGKEECAWNEGLMVELSLNSKGEESSFRLIPFTQCAIEPSVKLMEEAEAQAFKEKLASINDVLADPEALRKAYEAFLDRHAATYARVFAPNGKIARFLSGIGLLKPFLSQRKRLLLKDYIDCESHREGFSRFLDGSV